MKKFSIQMCRLDMYSDTYRITNEVNTEGDFLPRVGDKIAIHGAYWEVFDVIHHHEERSNKTYSEVRVK